MNIDIVIARYNENIDWSNQFKNVFIYNKGKTLNRNEIFLENVGRESHTYYKHIYDNYDNLNDYIIFLQGNPFDHSPYVITKLWSYIEKNNNLNIDFEYISEKIFDCKLSLCKHHIELQPFLFKTFNYLFDESRNITTDLTFKFGAGAQFIVSKKNILKRPKEFYLKIINLLNYNINPIEGFIIERFHNLILNPYKNIIIFNEVDCMLLFIYWMKYFKNNLDSNLNKIKSKYLKLFFKNSGFYDNKISNIDIIDNLYNFSNNNYYELESCNKYFSLILESIINNNSSLFEFNFNYNILNTEENNYLSEFISFLNIKQYGNIDFKIIDNFVKNKNILIITNNNIQKIKSANNINIYKIKLSYYNQGPHNNLFETVNYLIKDILNKNYLIDTIVIDAGSYGNLIMKTFIDSNINICLLN
jgi:hypothetical protein